MTEKVKTKYTIYAKGVDDAIDMKNTILANTIDKEEVVIDISVNESYILA